MYMANMFQPLSEFDIEEKWEINKNDYRGDLIKFKGALEYELAYHQREVIKLRASEAKTPFWKRIFLNKEYKHTLFCLDTQSQNLREQISYVENKILKELRDGNISK